MSTSACADGKSTTVRSAAGRAATNWRRPISPSIETARAKKRAGKISIENLTGYGTRLAARYDRQHQLLSGEVLIAISNSGKNCSPIEVALYARQKGLTVVALTSLAMSQATPSEHPSGKKLSDVADHVLDNGSVPGDAIVEVLPAAAGLPADLSAKASATAETSVKAGPTSTFIGCSVLNWLMLGTIDWLKQNQHPLPILRSQNLPGAIEHNRDLAQRYKGRLSRQLA